MNIFNKVLVRVSEEFSKKRAGFVNGEKYSPSVADAQVFWVSQAGLRRCGRVGGRGYLAVHHAVVVARCGCRTVGAKMLAEDWGTMVYKAAGGVRVRSPARV